MLKLIHYIILLLFLFLPAGNLSSQSASQYKFRVSDIKIQGNKITKESIIKRELEFSAGDSLTASEILISLENSENNLRNTYLFNFVNISYRITGFDIKISIELTERWYIWPAPILEVGERNLPNWLKEPDFGKLNYGLLFNWNNFRGRKDLLQSKIRLGFKEQYSLHYTSSNLDQKKRHGIILEADRFRQHQVSVRNDKDKPVYISENNNYILKSFHFKTSYVFRPYLYFKHTLTIGFNNFQYADTATVQEFLGIEGNKLEYFDIRYSFEIDKRDYKIYPLHGILFRADLYHQGTGIIPEFNYPKTYIQIVTSLNSQLKSGLYLENALDLNLTKNEDMPNIFERIIGYNSYIRGFEYYTINGNSYGILLNNLKFELLPPTTYIISNISSSQFNKTHLAIYMNLFLDAAYINAYHPENSTNQLPNKLLFSSGLGFDFVSYYDQVIRFEFTINSLKEPGLYLHLETPFRRW